MSEQRAKDNGENNGLNSSQNLNKPTQWKGEMTREQALAVIWSGMRALAMNGQVTIINHKKTNRAFFGIANARVMKRADSNLLSLIDLEKEPTLGVGDEKDTRNR